MHQKESTFSFRRMWNTFRASCLRLVIAPGFGLANAAIIFLNAVVLGLNW